MYSPSPSPSHQLLAALHFCNNVLMFGAIGASLCVVALCWVAWISVLLKRARRAVGDLESRQTATFIEYIANIRSFRLNGLDAYMQQKLDRMTDEMTPLRRRTLSLKILNVLTSFTLSPFMSLILVITQVRRLWVLGCGLWFVVYSLWFVVYNLASSASSLSPHRAF